ncbi:methyltransferase domain-containing protein [Bathymodiolus thermophilus thioautotrophic gill symbiont]|uniref:methyltransferase domain-containing protein n=1 Tax=Bathymodiolus thermophilus thioautotrophic gill symbiont TaxID=2360 RepID=UPI00192B1506|nr:methyltransferase domain-containing protein [Bathymodiolus thermophilus thioautotrophic gill symbiont]
MGKVFLEVGTGRVPLIPLAYWLMGAKKKTITMDLNLYTKEELIKESLCYISENKEKVRNLFGSLLNKSRFNKLLDLEGKSEVAIQDFLTLCQIEYISPSDASNTHLSDASIDFYTSNNVFEHIPKNTLKEIFNEGRRITKDNGLCVHHIDYSDHFSHSDKNISAINFLQYGDIEWRKCANNRYMYMNRMRHDGFIDLFADSGCQIIKVKTNVDALSQTLLGSKNFISDEKFCSKTNKILAITDVWIATQEKELSDPTKFYSSILIKNCDVDF